MKKGKNKTGGAEELRRLAEKRLEENLAGGDPLQEAGDLKRLVHELEVHKIQLQMQNEELQQAQRELEKSQSKYFELFDLAPVGYFTVSQDGLILNSNQAFANLVGIEKSRIIKQPVSSFVLEEDQNIYCLHRKQVSETGAEQVCELRMLHEDGAPFWARMEATILHEGREGNGPLRLVAVSDISDQKRIEAELRIKSWAVESTISAIAIADLDGRLTYVNPAWLKMWGYSLPEEALGKSATEFWLDSEKATTVMKELHATKSWIGELAAQDKNGACFDARIAASAITDAAGRIVYIQASFEDITKRKRAEAELKKSEEHHRIILDAATAGFWLKDSEGRLIEVNDAYCQMIGYSREELLSMRIDQLEAKENPEEIAAHIQEGMKQGGGVFETVHRRKDGGLIDIEVSFRFLPSKKGWFVGFLHDITERKRMEAELRSSRDTLETVVKERTRDLQRTVDKLQQEVAERIKAEKSLRLMKEAVETAKLGVTISDIRGKIVYVNPADAEMHGYCPEELLGQHVTIYTPEHLKGNYSNGDRSKFTDYNRESINIRKDGAEFPVNLSSGIVTNEYGVAVGIVTLCEDITERKAAEEALRKSEEKFRVLTEKSLVGIYIIQDSKLVYVNPKIAAIFGYKRDEMINRMSPYDLFLPSESLKVKKDIQERLTGVDLQAVEYLGYKKDGSLIDIRSSGTRIEYFGKPAILGTLRDITARKRSDKQLAEYQTQLISLASQLSLAEEESRRKIAVGIHDNIGPTLAHIKMRLTSILHEIDNPGAREELQEVQSAIGAMVGIMRTLTFELSPPILYDSGLEEALEWLAERSSEKYELKIVFQNDQAPKPLALESAIVLFQAARELLHNVYKHAGAESVSVKMVREGGNAAISVADDGRGFDPDEKGRQRGMKGFGLFNIKERLLHLGGNFAIVSSPGKGMEVTISLPLKKKEDVN